MISAILLLITLISFGAGGFYSIYLAKSTEARVKRIEDKVFSKEISATWPPSETRY